MQDSVTAASAIRQWSFPSQDGAGVQSQSSLVFDNVRFRVARLCLNEGAPGTSCLGCVAIQFKKHLDDCLCRLQGAAFARQADAALRQIHLPRFVEP